MELEQAKKNIVQMKKRLEETVSGKFMVRKDNGFKSLESAGIYTFNVYFDSPTRENKNAIFEAIHDSGFVTFTTDSRVIGGSYGYVITFRTKA